MTQTDKFEYWTEQVTRSSKFPARKLRKMVNDLLPGHEYKWNGKPGNVRYITNRAGAVILSDKGTGALAQMILDHVTTPREQERFKEVNPLEWIKDKKTEVEKQLNEIVDEFQKAIGQPIDVEFIREDTGEGAIKLKVRFEI